MKIYLDDRREAPEGWILARWPDEVIHYLESGFVTDISLDHDLGDDTQGTGYDVLLWIEEAVVLKNFDPPRIAVHTSNPSARKKMVCATDQISRLSNK